MTGLIWVQTVCKGYQQMAQVGKELMNEFAMFIISNQLHNLFVKEITDCMENYGSYPAVFLMSHLIGLNTVHCNQISYAV